MTRILVSYRRADTAGVTGRIVDRLVARYGREAVFVDVDNIPFGADFRRHIEQTMRASDVVLAVVGSQWWGQLADGRRRIDAADDPVRVEIELALGSKVTLVPVLIDATAMPKEAELPESIRELAFRNGAAVDSGRYFHRDVDRLIEAIDQLSGVVASRPRAGPVSSGAGPAVLRRIAEPRVLAAIGGAAAILAADFGGLAPPWPRGAAVVTAIVAAILVFVAHHLLQSKSPRTLRRSLVASAVLFSILACLYLGLVSLFTYQTPATRQHWAKGFVCTADALLIYKDKCPNLGIDELKGAEFEAERLWTPQSVTIVRVSLLFSWLFAIAAAAFLAAALLARRDLARPPAASD